MPFHQSGAVRYFTCPTLDEIGVLHGIFTRQGGVSPQPWASLNLGGTVGDERANVIENRRRCFATLERPVESGFDVWQVHSADVVCVNQPRPLDEPHQRADAILTDRSEITLLMRFADCVPILLADPVRRVVGLAHAGWQGTVKKVAAAAVEQMQAQYGSHPADIRAVIGPSICVEHYPVGSEVVEQVRDAFGAQSGDLLRGGPQQTHLDLWAANRLTLEQAGVQQIETAGLCTVEHLQDWYSHRGEQGQTGRFAVLMAWKDADGHGN